MSEQVVNFKSVSVKLLLFNMSRTRYFLLRRNVDVRNNPGKLELLGGKIDEEGESFQDALLREISEELHFLAFRKIKIDESGPFCIRTFQNHNGQGMQIIFSGKIKCPEEAFMGYCTNHLSDEHTEALFVDWGKAPEDSVPWLQRVVNEFEIFNSFENVQRFCSNR